MAFGLKIVDISANLLSGTSTIPTFEHNINDNNDVCDDYGNISEEPIYIDADSGYFQLENNSPNIDAGNPDWFDQDNTRSDIGVFPYLQNVAIMGVSTSAIDFGTVTVGDTSFVSFTVSSLGTIDLEVNQMLLSENAFTVEPTSFTLPSGENQVVTVTFAPMGFAPSSCRITRFPSCESFR